MKLNTISVTYGRKLNLGDYNSSHVEMSLWADLEDGDDPVLAAEALRQMARLQVAQELGRLEPKIAAKVEGVFAGLPVSVQAAISENGEEDHAD